MTTCIICSQPILGLANFTRQGPSHIECSRGPETAPANPRCPYCFCHMTPEPKSWHCENCGYNEPYDIDLQNSQTH